MSGERARAMHFEAAMLMFLHVASCYMRVVTVKSCITQHILPDPQDGSKGE